MNSLTDPAAGPASSPSLASNSTHPGRQVERVFIVNHNQGDSISSRMGQPEYSYHFVLEAMLPVLESLGEVVTVDKPDSQVDPLYHVCAHLDLPCVYLCFEPPHKIPRGLACPVIPFFAWEFADIPDQAWDGNPYNDWRVALGQCEAAVVHSHFAAAAIRRAIGETPPVVVSPAPVWDSYQDIDPPRPGTARRLKLPANTVIADTGRSIQHSACENEEAEASVSIDLECLLATSDAVPQPQELILDGVVFTSVFSNADGRKRWKELVAAFCLEFSDDPDATLILKFIDSHELRPITQLLRVMGRLPDVRCRVIGISGFLDASSYQRLIEVSDYCINHSNGEGQCLPLMEFMSAGRPAIAPCHTAMTDYLDEDAGFLVTADAALAAWPHDARNMLSTRHFQPRLDSLTKALRNARHVAIADRKRFDALSANARDKLKSHASQSRVRATLAPMLLAATDGAAAEAAVQ